MTSFSFSYTHEQLVNTAQFSRQDMDVIMHCRRQHNRLGFAYQMAFVRLANRFPAHDPFEMVDDILMFTSVQLRIPSPAIADYTHRRQTIDEHREQIRMYLGLHRFGEEVLPKVRQFIFEHACRTDQFRALLAKTQQFLHAEHILSPAEDTLRRLIVTQREEARQWIFKKISGALSEEVIARLNALLETGDSRQSEFNRLKHPPGRPSPAALLTLTEKLDRIEATGVLTQDVSWLNNNYQRTLTHQATQYHAAKLRRFHPDHRYAVVICFLWQTYRETIDHLVEMYDKLVNKVYKRAQEDLDAYHTSQRTNIRHSLATFKAVAELIVDETVDDAALRQRVFQTIERKDLLTHIQEVDRWLRGKHSHVFNLVKERFSYIRQFSPALIQHLQIFSEDDTTPPILQALDILRDMNDTQKRKLSEDAPLDFIPKKLRPLVTQHGTVEKAAWECALLTALRDELKSGNLAVKMSTRFGQFDDFFIPHAQWHAMREAFFQHAGLPSDSTTVTSYVTDRLNAAFDHFLTDLPTNPYARVDEDGWHLSSDPAEHLSTEAKTHLEALNAWLSHHMRTITLPDLLIEVDNDVKMSGFFLPASRQEAPHVDDICAILATILAHGCNIGPYTMSQMIHGISYHRIQHITDWLLTDDSLRAALAVIVNAIRHLDITQAWGTGKTSSSDGQRFALRRNVLQQTYTPKFHDFALEFYSFVADNYAPFYSLPIECTDRDAPYVLDGLLYNESDLSLEEHYTDTHGYTDINFAAFAMLGRRFAPRIKGLRHQRIYRIDTTKDYHALSSLVDRYDRTLHVDWVCDQWDRMGQFFASLECGHVTASTALKRLNGYRGKNHFYRAVRELGRIFKTEHILQYMSDRNLRQRTRQGLLKGEQLHALARDLNYGKRGRLGHRDLQEQRNACSCLTLILASIVYWQAKEINRVVLECHPEKAGIDLTFMEHISPIAWDNVILYGEYVLHRELIKL